jgi:hypothetical protein
LGLFLNLEDIMAARSRSVALVVMGVALASLSVLADVIGVGTGPGFGWKQIVGTVLGIVIAGVGVWGIRSAS